MKLIVAAANKPQTPAQLQEFIKTCDNGLLAAAATINFMRAWMEEREII